MLHPKAFVQSRVKSIEAFGFYGGHTLTNEYFFCFP